MSCRTILGVASAPQNIVQPIISITLYLGRAMFCLILVGSSTPDMETTAINESSVYSYFSELYVDYFATVQLTS